MKKLSLTLIAIALVASLGFVSIANASVASAAEADTEEANAYGIGTLTAEGDGIAILGGRGMVDISGNGILWIKDLTGDAIIEVTGYGEKKVFDDGWVQYAGFHGTAHVEGKRIIAGLAGGDIELFAQGRGRVKLWGHGTYEIHGQTSEWGTGFGTRVRLAAAPSAS